MGVAAWRRANIARYIAHRCMAGGGMLTTHRIKGAGEHQRQPRRARKTTTRRQHRRGACHQWHQQHGRLAPRRSLGITALAPARRSENSSAPYRHGRHMVLAWRRAGIAAEVAGYRRKYIKMSKRQAVAFNWRRNGGKTNGWA